MSPFDLVLWSIAIVIALSILSSLGIQDWLSQLILRQPSRQDLQLRVDELERRVAALERSVSQNQAPVS